MLRLATFLLATLALQAQETNPFASDPNAVEVGRWSFRIYCASCHGIHDDGGRGPDLTLGTYAAGDEDSDLFRVIPRGVPGSEMAGYAGRVEDEGFGGWLPIFEARHATITPWCKVAL